MTVYFVLHTGKVPQDSSSLEAAAACHKGFWRIAAFSGLCGNFPMIMTFWQAHPFWKFCHLMCCDTTLPMYFVFLYFCCLPAGPSIWLWGWRCVHVVSWASLPLVQLRGVWRAAVHDPAELHRVGHHEWTTQYVQYHTVAWFKTLTVRKWLPFWFRCELTFWLKIASLSPGPLLLDK